AEFSSMLEDVAALRQLGVAGVVIGCLGSDGAIDEARTRALVERARPMRVTFHRAFDMASDAEAALEALIRCGVDRVLTSGQRAGGAPIPPHGDRQPPRAPHDRRRPRGARSVRLSTAHMTYAAAHLSLKDSKAADRSIAKAIRAHPEGSTAYELWSDIRREQG